MPVTKGFYPGMPPGGSPGEATDYRYRPEPQQIETTGTQPVFTKPTIFGDAVPPNTVLEVRCAANAPAPVVVTLHTGQEVAGYDVEDGDLTVHPGAELRVRLARRPFAQGPHAPEDANLVLVDYSTLQGVTRAVTRTW